MIKHDDPKSIIFMSQLLPTTRARGECDHEHTTRGGDRHPALGIALDKNILRLQVAVDDSRTVHKPQRREQLQRNPLDARHRKKRVVPALRDDGVEFVQVLLQELPAHTPRVSECKRRRRA